MKFALAIGIFFTSLFANLTCFAENAVVQSHQETDSDDDYFNDTYQMYDRQENSAYYTGLPPHEQDDYKKDKPKPKQECSSNDDCIDDEDRNYGLQMQDDSEDSYQDPYEDSDSDKAKPVSLAPYNQQIIYKILAKESVSDADFTSSSTHKKTKNFQKKTQSKKPSTPLIYLTEKYKVANNEAETSATTNDAVENQNKNNDASTDTDPYETSEESSNMQNENEFENENQTENNHHYILNEINEQTLQRNLDDDALENMKQKDLENSKSQSKSQSNVDIKIDGNFGFATSDSPTPQYIKDNFGRSDKFIRNLDVRSSFFVNANFERKINDDVSLLLKTQLDIGSNANYDEGQSLNVNKAFFQLKVKNGSTTELGITRLSSENLRVDASTFAKGTGGIDGDIFRLFSNSYSAVNATSGASGASNPTFITIPRSAFYSGLANSAFLGNASSFNINHGNAKIGQGDDFASFSYYTRRFGQNNALGSIKFAASFAPITEDLQSKKASNLLNPNNTTPTFVVTNAYSAVLNYYKSFFSNRGSFVFTISHDGGRVGLDKSLSSTQTNIARNDINITTAGFNLEYLGFIIGSSYSHWGKSMYYADGSQIVNGSSATTNPNGSDDSKGKSYYYTGGVGYSVGPLGISLGMLKSKFIGNEFQNYTLSTQYDLIANESYKIRHFVELSRFEFNADNTLQNLILDKYTGYAMITGFKIQI